MAEEETQDSQEQEPDSTDPTAESAPEPEQSASEAQPPGAEAAEAEAAEAEAAEADVPIQEEHDPGLATEVPIPNRAQFEQLNIENLGDLEKFVERYDDVPLKVSIELGRVTKTLRDILEWKEGSIVETQKLSGNPMEILVNGSLFGHGEVVVVGDNLAIRITDLEKPNVE